MAGIMRGLAPILSCRAEWDQGGKDDGVAEAPGAGGDGFAEGCPIGRVGACDLLDDSVEKESFPETGDLPAGFAEQGPKRTAAEVADGESPANQPEEEVEVFAVEPMETGKAGAVLAARTDDGTESEEANPADPQGLGHRLGARNVDETAGEEDAVETGPGADDLVGVGFGERGPVGTLMSTAATRRGAA
jgi:hypothetical protein